MKRILDILLSAFGLVLVSPLLVVVAAAIYAYDRKTPFYIAPRVGQGGRTFRMVKFRSMVVNADRTGVTSTSASDMRITPVGHFVRRFKIDELLQLVNVLRGDMSLVGPRPNVPSGVAVYTPVERHLLDVRPGITDFASIVFSDEADILAPHADPDAAYDVLIRPGKSRLGLFYIERRTILVDLKLIFLTVLAVASRRAALDGVHSLLVSLGAPADLCALSLRRSPLLPGRPPDAAEART